MLRLTPDRPVATLWEMLLPEEVQILPDDLTRIDTLLADAALLEPFQRIWDAGARGTGRPTIPMAVYVRVMVIKQRSGWGYETLMREVSDSLHLRRFCLLRLDERVPDESTVRKLTRRLGSAVVDEMIRGLVSKACHERRFRPRAMRVDSTVVEADIRYPNDAGLCAEATRCLAYAARAVRQIIPSSVAKVRDRSRAVGKRLRAMNQRLRQRQGEGKAAVERYTKEAAAHVRASIREARRLLCEAKRRRARAAGRSSRGRQGALAHLQETIARAERVVQQVQQRFRGEPIKDRLVSLADPEARPIRRGKRGKPNEFGYIVQFAELTNHTRRGARGLLMPPKLRAGSTHDDTLLPDNVAEVIALGLQPREAVFDAGFSCKATTEVLTDLRCEVFIAGVTRCASRRTWSRRARYRVGSEGRISHLKRGYDAGRSRLRGTEGARIWESWVVFAYDLDTVALMPTIPPRETP
jgi:IS5 family transposase